MSATRSPDAAIARRAFRQVRVSTAVVAVGFGAMVASTAVAYASSYPTDASRRALAVLAGRDTGLRVLLGTTSGVGSVGGYTVYKVFVTLTTIGAIWGLLLATRLLRGEEDLGRWQLVLVGGTRPARATWATLLALTGAVVVVFVVATALTLVAGSRPGIGFGIGESALYGLSLAVAPAVFVGVGALTSQLGRIRRQATGLGMSVFAVALVLRMVADSGPGLRWVAWLTPFGWVELMQPFTDNNAWPLLPALVAVIALFAGAAALSARRDAGAGVFASSGVSSPRPFGLGSPMGLAARMELPTLTGWCVGAGAAGLGLGIIAKVTTAEVPASVSDTFQRFGVRGSYSVQYFGVGFLLVAMLVALIPASQLGAAADEELSGRLVHLLVRPVRRSVWLGGRLALAAAAIVGASLLASIAAWLGATSQGVRLDLGSMLAAGANVIPTALIALGVGSVVLGVAPRAAAATVYVLIIGSTFVDLLSALVPRLDLLDRLSLFHYLALAPAQDPNPVALTVMTVAGVGLCGLALVLVKRPAS